MSADEVAYLLDANVLIALLLAEHQHHDRAHRWFVSGPTVAISPIVQGAPLRTDVDLRHVRGHRQVTDAYLAGLARHHGSRLATMDEGFGLAAPDVATVLPS